MGWIGDMFASINPLQAGLDTFQSGLDIYGAQAADRANRKAVDKQWRRNMDADNTAIQRRVADAQKAGVHPLYALGVNPASGPAASVVPSEQGEAFRSVSRSIANRMTPMERAIQMAQLEEIKSRTDLNHAERLRVASEQARLAQQSNTTGSASVGEVNVIPAPVLSKDKEIPYSSAGNIPGMSLYDTPYGPRYMPSQATAEIYEALGEILGPIMAARDMSKANWDLAARKNKKTFKRNFKKFMTPWKDHEPWKKYPMRRKLYR